MVEIKYTYRDKHKKLENRKTDFNRCAFLRKLVYIIDFLIVNK